MSSETRRSTVYFESSIHNALRVKAASTHQSVSELVNEAVRQFLAEDQEDLAAFDARRSEPTVTYAELLNDLKAHDKI
jgi:plasmid stability protein